MTPRQFFASALVATAVGALARAQTVITGNIATSTTLTLANSPYQLRGEVYVLPGATLTIHAGVEFRSMATGTLAITRGAQIIANGTKDAPIVFTSSSDTDVYRQLANNEWGNLTLMGAGYISADATPGNTSVPAATNYADMEGLTPANPALDNYGGGNDNDDSGTLAYCTFRYGGIATLPGKELNGLSLGGVGRNTNIHHIEVLNSLDDGIEIWGGTVNLKYISIWNVGDDSFDIDQGWRGKAQFGLLVQGLSSLGKQGSGFGDNAFEIDGAERCDWQPVTTTAISNFTVIGGQNNVVGGAPTDDLVVFRDNARVQFLNCIWMDAGKVVLRDEVTTNPSPTLCGPGSAVPQLFTRMTTSAAGYYAINAFPGAPELAPAQAYTAQDPAGMLVQFRGGIYYNNNAGAAYATAVSVGLFPLLAPVAGVNHANNEIVLPNGAMPITARTRGPEIVAIGHAVKPITFLNPLPTAAAWTAAEFNTDDGFFTPARYVGGFAHGNDWLLGWTSTSQYGLTPNSQSNTPITGVERGGVQGVPVHYTDGDWSAGSPVTMHCENLDNIGGTSIGVLVFGANQLNTPVFGGTVVPSDDAVFVLTGAPGSVQYPTFTMPTGLAGATFYSQFLAIDQGVPAGELAFSNAQRHILP